MSLMQHIKGVLFSRPSLQKGRGYVINYNRVYGWGFIWCETSHQELFVHKSFICKGSGVGYLIRGQEVSFKIAETEEGVQAHDVDSNEFLPHQHINYAFK